MQNVVIDFKVNNTEIIETAQMLEELGQVAQGTAEKFRKSSEANRAIREAEQQAIINEYKAVSKLEIEVEKLGRTKRETATQIGNSAPIVARTRREFDGLTQSINQLTREAPAATVSLNTFFLAISNNIPMFTDEIQKLRKANVELAASGQPTVSVLGSITKAFFSWTTLISVAITALTIYGSKLVEFITGTKDATKAQYDFNKELEKSEDIREGNEKNFNRSVIDLRERNGAITAEEAQRLRLKLSFDEEYLKQETAFNKSIKANDQEIKDHMDSKSRISLSDYNRIMTERNNLIAEKTVALKLLSDTYNNALLSVGGGKVKGTKAAIDGKDDNGKFDKADLYKLQVEATKKAYEDEKVLEENRFIGGERTHEEYTKNMLILQERFLKQKVDDAAFFNKDIVFLEEDLNQFLIKQKLDLEKELLKIEEDAIKNKIRVRGGGEAQARKAGGFGSVQEAQELADARLQIASASFGALRTINQSYSDYEIALFDQQLADKQITQEMYENKVRESKAKTAQTDKDLAAFEAIINTSAAIIRMLANPGGTTGVALSIAAGITGAAQLAAIAATPIPKFAKGTKNAPSGFKWVGEEGAELISTGGGETIMPHKKSLEFAHLMMDGALPSMNLLVGGKSNYGNDFDYLKLGKVIAKEMKNTKTPELNIHINNEVGKLNYNIQRYG